MAQRRANLRELLIRLEVSPVELERKTGFPRRTVYNLMAGKGVAREGTIVMLARALDLDEDQVWEAVEESQRRPKVRGRP